MPGRKLKEDSSLDPVLKRLQALSLPKEDPKPSVVNVSQLISLEKTRLTERIKGIDTPSMLQVDEGLRLVMTL